MERSSLLHIRTCNFLPRDSSPLWCHRPQREAANGGPASRQHSRPPLPHCAQSSAPVQPLKETACSFLHAGWDKHGFVFISRVCWWHGPGWGGGSWGDVRIYKHRNLTSHLWRIYPKWINVAQCGSKQKREILLLNCILGFSTNSGRMDKSSRVQTIFTGALDAYLKAPAQTLKEESV